MRYAVVREGTVENVVLWDGETAWSPREGAEPLPCPDRVSIGWRRVGEAWLPPLPEELAEPA